jgi:DNA-binding response OmpR family regulator
MMSQREKVLVVDDEPLLRETMAQILSISYQVLLADTAEAGIQLARAERPCVVIMDIRMQGMGGVEACRLLRSNPETSSIQILMITAFHEETLKGQCFAAGADDFIEKPFRPEDLLIRVDAKVRRAIESRGALVTASALRFGKIQVDTENSILIPLEGSQVDLTPLELRILRKLVQASGLTVSRAALVEAAWGAAGGEHRLLDPHVSSLRKKLALCGVDLKAIYREGYQLLEQKDSA